MSLHRNPKALLTPAMHKVLERMARAGRVPLHAMQPAQARAAYAAGAGVLELPSHPLARVEDFTMDCRDGHALPVRLYAPEHATGQPRLPVLVYFHGGGFVVGSIATHDSLCRQLSHHGQCAVLSVDYRLAPEHQFPTAVDDAWDAVQWVAQHGHSRALDGSRIAVGGDSAGGTLAAVCALMARDAGLHLALQLLFYPGTMARQTADSHHTFAHGFVIEAPHLDYFFGHYLRSDADRDDWRFAPLDGLTPAGTPADLSGVAPVWLGLAECDPLVDEGVHYGDQLRRAGVEVDLEIYRGVVHEFIKMGRAIPEGPQAHADAARALRKAFAV